MLKTYQGYFNNGQFISLDNVPIPEKKKVIITVLEDEFINIDTDVKNLKNISEQQNKAFVKYFKAIDSIEEELFTEEDFAVLENNRLNFRRELNL